MVYQKELGLPRESKITEAKFLKSKVTYLIRRGNSSEKFRPFIPVVEGENSFLEGKMREVWLFQQVFDLIKNIRFL